jgi:hypothetical protein
MSHSIFFVTMSVKNSSWEKKKKKTENAGKALSGAQYKKLPGTKKARFQVKSGKEESRRVQSNVTFTELGINNSNIPRKEK